MFVLEMLLMGVEGVLALLVAYLLLLTIAAWFAPRRTPARNQAPTHRFLFLLPAHNEERLLPGLLENVRQLEYPSSLYAVHVVADNCTDRTAVVAREGGAVVHERFDTTQIGKGYALQWLLQCIWASGEPHDAVIVLDADSVVSSNFLTIMDARMARGERAIQAYYAVRDPEQSWSASLRSVALAALHYLRPQGRSVLGGSTGLKGNGMVFARDIAMQHPWPVSLTEDIEYHMALIMAGERVMFAPDAVVWAEMPGTLAASHTQNVRWERGRMEMIRRYVPELLAAALRRRSFLLFDAAIEQLIPPFSILAMAGVAVLFGALLLGSMLGMGLAIFILAGQAVYVLNGLMLAGVPRKVYQALLYAPLFIVWKLWLYVRVLLGFDRGGWVRTARNE
ncbi:MAG TPA: glycosyltransferase family 2 protein [Roseiflexaceae bacterium]|nr:glycosyltransferase family 2 protein [Roseiflexaceae bacterium]